MKYISYLIILTILLFSLPSYASTIEIAADLDNNNPFTSQTRLGSFLTQIIKEVASTDIAFICSSAIKGGISRGYIDVSLLKDLFYYPQDKIVILELTGEQIKSALERSVGSYPGESSNFLQASGITGNFDSSQPSGNRITALYIGGSPVDANRSYRVALDENLAGGFSGYVIFTQGKFIGNSLTLGQAIENYGQSHSVIGQPTDSGLKPR